MADGADGAVEDAATLIARLQRERELYRKLLEIGGHDEIEPFLEEALALMTEMAGARRGYLELQGEGEDGPPRYWIARGCSEDDVAAVRDLFSRGVIAHALASGETTATVSALDDPRFRERGSVRKNRIEAVLCAPIGTDPPLGVIYLQDRAEPGPFREEERVSLEVFARHVATFADRLLLHRRRRDESDPTLRLRRTLRADNIIGRSVALARVLEQVALVAPLDVSVLLTGPTGGGKTALARLLHENSPRASRPFVEVNCATLPESLLESELFGAFPGAHSTAVRRVHGKVEAAQGGTLFLDEVGELNLGAQAKLLQLLQSKEYYPLGSPKPAVADVRVIAATNTDLKAAAGRKSFREDLYYRLHVLPLRVPSLAERREDIPELTAYFCERARRTHNLPLVAPSVGALRAIEAAEWPGNVRELAHAVEAAAIRGAAEGLLRFEQRHVFPEMDDPDRPGPERLTFQAATRRFQADLLRQVLEETGWNVTEAAARLDLARSHVYNLVRAFGLERRRG